MSIELLNKLPKEFTIFKVTALLDKEGVSIRVVNVGLAKVTAKKINYDGCRVNHSSYLSASKNEQGLSSIHGWRKSVCFVAEEHIELAKQKVVDQLTKNKQIDIEKLNERLNDIKSHTNFEVVSLKEYLED